MQEIAVTSLGIWVIVGIPLRAIQKKAGLPVWPLFFMFIPAVGILIVLGWLAMTKWPDGCYEGEA
jgi:hypothetical protein